MEDSSKIFKDAIDKAYTRQPNVKLNATTMGDALKFKSSFTEEKTEDISKEDQKEMVDGIVEIVKKVKDINEDAIKQYLPDGIDIVDFLQALSKRVKANTDATPIDIDLKERKYQNRH